MATAGTPNRLHLRTAATRMASKIPSTHDFQFISGCLALDFVNTVGNRMSSARDYFSSPRDALRWARLVGIHARTGDISRSDLAEIRGRRENLHALFAPCCCGLSPNTRALAHLNRDVAALSGSRALRRVAGGYRWTVTGSAAERLAYLIDADAADLLNSGRFRLISQCQDHSCGWLFLDRSKRKNRRWCSMADCGNRAKARRHYAHTRDSGP
jgi:predicted RNA-binding Zn ribbon-like protein